MAESKGNVSYAKLVTILNNADDKKTLTCRAFNPKFSKPNDYLEQSLVLDVNCKLLFFSSFWFLFSDAFDDE